MFQQCYSWRRLARTNIIKHTLRRNTRQNLIKKKEKVGRFLNILRGAERQRTRGAINAAQYFMNAAAAHTFRQQLSTRCGGGAQTATTTTTKLLSRWEGGKQFTFSLTPVRDGAVSCFALMSQGFATKYAILMSFLSLSLRLQGRWCMKSLILTSCREKVHWNVQSHSLWQNPLKLTRSQFKIIMNFHSVLKLSPEEGRNQRKWIK